MPKTDNRTIGGRFEQELAAKLAEGGMWCHVMQQNKAGQPADLIAVKGKYHTLIDCKVVSGNGGFPFSRMEENQRSAMLAFCQKGGEDCWFALKMPDGAVYMLSYSGMIMKETGGAKRMTEEQIRRNWTLEQWIDAAKVWAEDS